MNEDFDSGRDHPGIVGSPGEATRIGIPISSYAPGYKASRNPNDRREEPITKDIAFNRHSFGERVVSPLNTATLQVGIDNINVELVQGIDEENMKKVLGTIIAYNAGKDPTNLDAIDWKEMLRGGLATALETQVVIFAVTGVSRACTHQIVRTRKAAFHQQSQRGHYYGDKPEARMPESIWRNERARAAYIKAIEAAHEAYEIACEEDIAYQDARYALPESTNNYIMCEYPLRTFIDTYAYRACSMFQWEIQHVFREMKRVLCQEHPWLEPYVKISCEKTAKDPADRMCTYQGYEFVDDQCTFSWAREERRTFRPTPEHREHYDYKGFLKELPVVS